jgi:tetratricopeptide (TPR) repeat protein
MLETLREYGLEQLARGGEGETIRRRHAAYYVALAEMAGPRLQGAEQRVWQRRLETDIANFRAAFRWAVERGEAELALRLGAGWAGFWRGVDFWLAWADWAQREGLAMAPALPGPVRATVLKEVARHIWWTQQDYPRATALLQEALRLFSTTGDAIGIAETLWYQADVARDEEDYVRAGRLYAESLARLEQIADAPRIAWLSFSWAEMALLQGNHAQALARYEQSLPRFREHGPRWAVAWALHRLGLVAQRQRDLGRAAALYREAVALAWEVGDPHGVAVGLTGLASIATQLDDGHAGVGKDAPAGALRGARLLGAVAQLHESRDLGIARALQLEIDGAVTEARERLDPAAYDTAWREGRAMTPEQAVAYALEDEGQQSPDAALRVDRAAWSRG